MAKYCEKQQSIIQGRDWHQYICSAGIFNEPTEKQVLLSYSSKQILDLWWSIRGIGGTQIVAIDRKTLIICKPH